VEGGTNDFVAQVTSGLISTAEGSFLSVTPGITETGIDPYTGQATANAFTLQLNTNTLLLECVLPGCMKAGFGYYTSTLSFDQAVVRRATVQLIFAGATRNGTANFRRRPP
jgi:hypothetical protein